jgi:hypothetical protein
MSMSLTVGRELLDRDSFEAWGEGSQLGRAKHTNEMQHFTFTVGRPFYLFGNVRPQLSPVGVSEKKKHGVQLSCRPNILWCVPPH